MAMMKRTLLLLVPAFLLAAWSPAHAAVKHTSKHLSKASKKKTTKKATTHHALAAKPAARWSSYHDDNLKVAIQVPAAWKAKKTSQVMGFTSPVVGNGHAGVGIMKSQNIQMALNDAVQQQYETEGRPAFWKRSDTLVGGQPAVRILFAPKTQSDRWVAQYFVQGPEGPYLLQCMAPRAEWAHYYPVFSTILQRVHFL
jgi:hypothetical protein